MDTHDRYAVDPALADSCFKKFMRGRYNVGGTGLSPSEQSVLQFAIQGLERTLSFDPDADTTPYIECLSQIYDRAKSLYDKLELGSWSLAGFRALTDLGRSVSQGEEHFSFARIHFKSQLMTMTMLPDQGTLDSAAALYIKFLVKEGMGSRVRAALDTGAALHLKAIEFARDSSTINEWLMRIAELSPLTDAQFLIWRCISSLVKQHHLTELELSRYDGIDYSTCCQEEKRLDEFSAYTGSHAISWYKVSPNACIDYINRIMQVAQKQGARVARRQAKYDFARLMAPRFLMDDACDAI